MSPITLSATYVAGTVAPAPDYHWGAITAGIGGVATAGALLISLVLLRQQMQEARQARLDRHREHASSIAFWIELAGAWQASPPYTDHPGASVQVHIHNTSARPAMQVMALVGIRDDVWRDAGKADKTKYAEAAAE